MKRLGYTVQRTRRFLPLHFTAGDPTRKAPLPPFETWWKSLPRWLGKVYAAIVRLASTGLGRIRHLDVGRLWHQSGLFRGTLLASWRGDSFGELSYAAALTSASMFSHLRIVPTGHHLPLPPVTTIVDNDSIYNPLISNPYLPFFNIWKPATPWSKGKWDKGSDEGIARQKPDYIAAIIE
jgi:tRNA-splicing endonuclease subunit Sen54